MISHREQDVLSADPLPVNRCLHQDGIGEDNNHAKHSCVIYVTPFRDIPKLKTFRGFRNLWGRVGEEMKANRKAMRNTEVCGNWRDQNAQKDANQIQEILKKRIWRARHKAGETEGEWEKKIQWKEAETTERKELKACKKKEFKEAWYWSLEEEPRQGSTVNLTDNSQGCRKGAWVLRRQGQLGRTLQKAFRYCELKKKRTPPWAYKSLVCRPILPLPSWQQPQYSRLPEVGNKAKPF